MPFDQNADALALARVERPVHHRRLDQHRRGGDMQFGLVVAAVRRRPLAAAFDEELLDSIEH